MFEYLSWLDWYLLSVVSSGVGMLFCTHLGRKEGRDVEPSEIPLILSIIICPVLNITTMVGTVMMVSCEFFHSNVLRLLEFLSTDITKWRRHDDKQ